MIASNSAGGKSSSFPAKSKPANPLSANWTTWSKISRVTCAGDCFMPQTRTLAAMPKSASACLRPDRTASTVSEAVNPSSIENSGAKRISV